MGQIEKLYVHRSRWDRENGGRVFAPGHVIHSAHRPLLGHTMWEGGNVGWGCHFAALTDSGKWPEDAWLESNRKNDARRVVLVSNADSIELAVAGAKLRVSYGLADYVEALGGREGAREFCSVYGLPWDDGDDSADAMIAAVSE